MGRKKKRKSSVEEVSTELNIMPFIDIFSILNTFLLVSAAFVKIGLIEVQVPFMTNAPPPKDKPPRSLAINVAVDREKVELETRWDQPPEDLTKKEYTLQQGDLDRLHADLVQLRQKYPEFDKVDVFSEDDVKYKELVRVLDTIMLHRKGDPIFEDPSKKNGKGQFIYRKVVMAGVIL